MHSTFFVCRQQRYIYTHSHSCHPNSRAMRYALIPSDHDPSLEPIIVTKEEVAVSTVITTWIETASDAEEYDVEDDGAALESKGDDDTYNGPVTDIVLPMARYEILCDVIEYCRMYHKEPMTELPKPMQWPKRVLDMVQPQFARYVYTKPYDRIWDIVSTANYLDIGPLMELCLFRVARVTLNKTPEMLRKALNIKKEWSEEEEKIIMEENRWTTDPTPKEMLEAEPADLILEKLGVVLQV